jgi:hypothetical protein
MKHLKPFGKLEESKIYEGTSDYWPGYSDDNVFDYLIVIRKKTSKVQNDELRKLEDEVLKPASKSLRDIMGIDETGSMFWQKQLYANLIVTSLQDGFYIDASLFNKALDLFKEVLGDPKLDEYTKDSSELFRNTLTVIVNKMEELRGKKLHGKDDSQYYKPGFLDRDDRERQSR